jgi:hypothetical protein
MAVQQGKGHVFGLGATIAFTKPDGTSLSGYVTPDIQTLRVSHQPKVDEIKGQDGEYNAFIVSGEKVECEFTFIPQGTTIANAKLSAQMPPIGSSGAISGLPVIPFGSFADVFNTGVWYYQGAGSDSGQNDTNWTGTFTLVRYPGITTTTAISA